MWPRSKMGVAGFNRGRCGQESVGVVKKEMGVVLHTFPPPSGDARLLGG